MLSSLLHIVENWKHFSCEDVFWQVLYILAGFSNFFFQWRKRSWCFQREAFQRGDSCCYSGKWRLRCIQLWFYLGNCLVKSSKFKHFQSEGIFSILHHACSIFSWLFSFRCSSYLKNTSRFFYAFKVILLVAKKLTSSRNHSLSTWSPSKSFIYNTRWIEPCTRWTFF